MLETAANLPSLKRRLIERIKRDGPISIEAYIETALWDTESGYYATADPIGARGQFTTAPEVSQMFGELIGLWAASSWDTIGRPGDINLVELGPGRGTMMADALRAIRAVCDMEPDVHLVETSPIMQAHQAKQVKATWHAALSGVPEGAMIILANEFFDALPIRQIVKADSKWREVLLGITEDGAHLQPRISGQTEALKKYIPEPLVTAADDSVVEISPSRIRAIEEIAERLRCAPGIALIVDYGPAKSTVGETLQALGPQGFADPYSEPGAVDLSAHVDFSSLKRAAENAGVSAHGPITQKDFLERLGINQRADMLKIDATPEQRAEIDSTLIRLLAPAQMGSLFKVLTLTSLGLPAPPGFAS